MVRARACVARSTRGRRLVGRWPSSTPLLYGYEGMRGTVGVLSLGVDLWVQGAYLWVV
jgi:hypothetical protein